MACSQLTDILTTKVLHQSPIVVVEKDTGGSDVIGVPLPRSHQPSPFLNETGGVLFERIFFGGLFDSAEDLVGEFFGDFPRLDP